MRFSIALIVCLSTLGATHAAGAAVRLMTTDGKALRWPEGKQIMLRVDPTHAPTDGSTLMKILTDAFATWDAAAADAPRATAIIDTDPTDDGDAPTHRVQVLTEDWPYDETTLAVTTYTYSKKTAELVDADIVVNGSGPCFSTDDKVQTHCYDLLSVLTHEAGHFLGLDHNSQESTAVMYPTLSAGDVSKRVLSDDDRQGIAEGYGAAPVQAAASSPAVTKSEQTTRESDPTRPAADLVAVRHASCSQSDPSTFSLWAFALFGPLALRRLRRMLMAVLALFVMVGTAQATSHVRTVQKATDFDALVVGRAHKGHSYVDPALGLVVTEYTVDAVACLGANCQPQGRFLMLGGEVNGLVTRVAGEAVHDETSTFVFSPGKNGFFKRVSEATLPLDMLHTLEARGLLSASTRLGR